MKKSIYSAKNQILLKWLIHERNENGLSQRKLAEKLNLHHSIVGKIETGERRLDVCEYLDYCDALNVDPIIGIQILKER